MFYIVMDRNTGTYYMEPGQIAFYAYTDPSNMHINKKNVRLIPTELEDIKELETMFYNAGFFMGFIDNDEFHIKKTDIYYFNRNPNEVFYAQYLLTKEERYLEQIRKHQLITLCSLKENSVLFPTCQNESGDYYVLTYTDTNRIPEKIFRQYPGWSIVKMTFPVKCLVNGNFMAE